MSVLDVIEAHKLAVANDEANFTEDCKPIDQTAADASAIAEQEAFAAFIAAPCKTAKEVQAKIAYALSDPPGYREANLSGLLGGDGDSWDVTRGHDLLRTFLASLVVQP